MSGVFHPLTAQASGFLPAFGAGGGHTRCVEMGWGVNSSVDARHCSVLYICKYFVEKSQNPLNIPDPEHWQKKWVQYITTYFSVAVTRVRGAVPAAAVPVLGKTSFSF